MLLSPRNRVLLIAAVTAAASCAAALADSISVALDLDPLAISEAADGYVDVASGPASEVASQPARPRLPEKTIVYALPPDADLSSVSVVVDRISHRGRNLRKLVRPGQPFRTSRDSRPDYGDARDVRDGKDRAVYERDGDYPASAARVESVSQMRRWKLVRVAVSPALYNPVRNTLKEVRHVDFRITYNRLGRQPAQALLADSVMDASALAMAANSGDAAAWYGATQPMDAPSGTVYLVMTTDEIFGASTNLFGLVPYKTALGYEVHVVTETKLDGNATATGWNEVTGQSPDGKADRMRKWLQDNYVSLGIEYVLLIGNPAPEWGDLPMKECHYQAYVYPVDWYFSDLTGNWDVDSNGYFGNETNDVTDPGGVDISPEVYVGRIPVYTGYPEWREILRGIIWKTIRYEMEPDTAWRRSALLPEAFSDASTDGAYLGENVRTNWLASKGYSACTLYEQGSVNTNYNSVFASDEELLDRSVPRHWANNAYGMVLWWAHGWSRGASVYAAGTLMDTYQCPALRSDRPAAVFMASCSCGEPTDDLNMSYFMLRSGGIASVAAGNVSWYYGGAWSPSEAAGHNASMGYHFFRRVVSNEMTFGQALAEVKYDAVGWWNNRYTFSLYGDPSLCITAQGADTDGDSLPDLWENVNSLDAGDPSDAMEDPDDDGFTNREEYEAGLDPQADDSPATSYSSMTVAATFNGWNAGANNMRLIADGTWRADLALTNQSGVEFKFAANGNWTTNWGEYDQLLTNLPMGGAADWESDNIVLPGTLDGRYRFTFNEYTRGYRVELAPEPDADSDGMPDAWETAHGLNPLNASDAGGNPDHDAYNNLQEYQHDTDPNAWNWPRTTLGGMCVAASFNGWAPSLTNMCLVADYTWRWDAAFTNLSGVEFKFAANGGWTTNWGDNDQSDTNVPFSGSGESYGANIRADTLTGSYRFMFNEQTLAYSLEAIATRDTDGDGIEDGWEADHGLNPKSGEDAWADADSDGLANHDEFSLDGDPGDGDTDGDGAGDLAEAIAGTGLANADSFFAADPGTSPTNFALSWPGATGRVYDVYSATGSLVNAAWNPVAGFTSITGSAGTMTVNLGPRPLAAEFFKVKVSR